MSKEALLFPGQGLASQEIISFHSRLIEINQECTSKALGLAQDTLNEAFGYKAFQIEPALRDVDHPNYKQTAFVQPVVYTLSIVSTDITGDDLNPSYIAGHSLGEYSALTYANVMTPEQGIQIVTARGKFMQEACEELETRLVSIHGLPTDTIREVFDDMISVALVNAPDITVVGCLKGREDEVIRFAKQIGASKANVLDTQGAFHTTYMMEAAAKLIPLVRSHTFNNPTIPVVSNSSGEISTNGQHLIKWLVRGMAIPVKWAKTIQTLKDEGVEAFIEAGPGNSLAILNRKNGVPREQTRNILDTV